MEYKVEKEKRGIYQECVIEGIGCSDAQLLSGLKEFWAKIEDTIGDLSDLDYLNVSLAGEDGDILVWGIAKTSDIALNRQNYRLIIKRLEYEWKQFDELDDDEFDIHASNSHVFYARLPEEARGERFSSYDVRYYELNGEGEDELI